MTAKFERLQQLSQHPDFLTLVPPLVGFTADKALAIVESHPHADNMLLRTLYSRARAYFDCYSSKENSCPIIIAPTRFFKLVPLARCPA
ncbi:hypothetical protein, partial [Photorhabdus sp. RM157S]|uniref:hypothetical protein n=1 Tax=Photorhabdus sp. RM157S TaxID=3342827 RepID=UPI0036DEEFA9